jgi:PASTA domain
VLALAGAVVPTSNAAADPWDNGWHVLPPPLEGTYAGTIFGDFGTSAPLTLVASGPPEAVAATVSLGSGARMNCHGDRALDPQANILLTGHRASANDDGSSTYDFTGRFEFDSTVHVVVDITIAGATLSPDSKTFAGVVDLNVQPSIGENCLKQWSFSTTLATRVVPSVLFETRETAKSILTAAGLQVRVTAAVDPICNNIGTVIRQTPRAGTTVLEGAFVTITIGTRPKICP